jgi:hypothetical protein
LLNGRLSVHVTLTGLGIVLHFDRSGCECHDRRPGPFPSIFWDFAKWNLSRRARRGKVAL